MRYHIHATFAIVCLLKGPKKGICDAMKAAEGSKSNIIFSAVGVCSKCKNYNGCRVQSKSAALRMAWQISQNILTVEGIWHHLSN